MRLREFEIELDSVSIEILRKFIQKNLQCRAEKFRQRISELFSFECSESVDDFLRYTHHLV
jgi:hypothetical protein